MVREIFTTSIRALTHAALSLQHATEFPEIDPALFQLPPRFREMRPWNTFTFSSQDGGAWVQHGDVCASHLYLAKTAGSIEIIDWSHARRGYPALYDCFGLLISCNYLDPKRRDVPASVADLRRASLSDLFFADNEVSALIGELLRESCADIGIAPELIPKLFLVCLVVQLNFHRSRGDLGETRAHAYEDLMQAVCALNDRPFLGRYSLQNATRVETIQNGIGRPVPNCK